MTTAAIAAVRTWRTYATVVALASDRRRASPIGQFCRPDRRAGCSTARRAPSASTRTPTSAASNATMAVGAGRRAAIGAPTSVLLPVGHSRRGVLVSERRGAESHVPDRLSEWWRLGPAQPPAQQQQQPRARVQRLGDQALRDLLTDHQGAASSAPPSGCRRQLRHLTCSQAVLTGRWGSRRLRWRSDEFRSRHRSEPIPRGREDEQCLRSMCPWRCRWTGSSPDRTTTPRTLPASTACGSWTGSEAAAATPVGSRLTDPATPTARSCSTRRWPPAR